MGVINRLDSSIFNRISAGEVVDRPRSVVKELVENSIDAGANVIKIEIAAGGKEFIRVTDNGSGLLPEDMPVAFLPHATSKIATIDDLDGIATLGFRGEALPSIAAVADVVMSSRRAESESGYSVALKSGQITRRTSVGMAQGTIISVENIFADIPARAKFLKRDKSEESEITKLVSDLILANPNVAITYIADGKSIFVSSGRGMEDAVYTVYQRDITNNLIPVEFNKNGHFVQGFISKAGYSKPTRAYQTCILNGRIITNSTISAAVMQAYGNSLMKRAFPVYVIDIVMPFDKLDVNVTPSKTDVRFDDNKEVFSVVFHAVKIALEKKEDIISVADASVNYSEEAASAVIAEDTINEISAKTNVDELKLKSLFDEKIYVTDSRKAVTDKISNQLKEVGAAADNVDGGASEINNFMNEISKITLTDYDNKPIRKINDAISAVQTNMFEEAEKSISDNFRIIGQIFDTYLLVSVNQFVYIIDQHAAHEKMLYDKLCKEISSNYITSQMLMIPEIVTLAPQDAEFISNILCDLQSIGLEIEEFGVDSFKILAVPSIFSNFKFNNYIEEILSNKKNYQQIKTKDLLRDKLAITACKGAVKGGSQFNETEIRALLMMMKDGVPLQCPHGRPAILKFEKKDIDKLFKRIL